MKIAITVEDFDSNKGYLEYYLSSELANMGHKVCVFTFGRSRRVVRRTLKEGFEVVNVPYVAVVNNYHVPSLSGVASIAKFAKVEKPDTVHCQPLFSPLSLLFISYQRLFKYKIVGSLMTGRFSIDNITKKAIYFFVKIIVERYVNNKSELVFVKSRELMEIMARLFDLQRQKFCVIPLGADPELFKFNSAARSQTRNLLGIHSDDVVIVYSGKIIPSKRLDVLIKAIAPIITRDPKVKLLIVGRAESSYMKCLKSLILDLNISKNVIFHKWVHRALLHAFYSASDIAVWPGSPSISIVEAASVGLPVIIERSPVDTYAIESGNGFAFERGNANELRKYLETLLYDDKLRREMSRKSRLLIEQKLNWRVIALQYLDAYSRIQ